MSEYTVTDEPDYERTYDEDEIASVRKGDLRAVLDVATMSMDFASGFLDNEQVEALRKAAVILGIDPTVATPANFACVYNGKPHDWRFMNYGVLGQRWQCLQCRHVDEDRPAPHPSPWPVADANGSLGSNIAWT